MKKKRPTKPVINLRSLNVCDERCDCRWNVTLGGIDTTSRDRIFKFIQDNFRILDMHKKGKS